MEYTPYGDEFHARGGGPPGGRRRRSRLSGAPDQHQRLPCRLAVRVLHEHGPASHRDSSRSRALDGRRCVNTAIIMGSDRADRASADIPRSAPAADPSPRPAALYGRIAAAGSPSNPLFSPTRGAIDAGEAPSSRQIPGHARGPILFAMPSPRPLMTTSPRRPLRSRPALTRPSPARPSAAARASSCLGTRSPGTST
jgi:hypothetical protein